jgi:predicted RNA-binding protein with PUA-like domain
MARWLFKQEPEAYSFADLERDGETAWDGVANPLALKHLRAAAAGDEMFFYHTGKEKAVVGVAVVGRAMTDAGPLLVKPVRRLAKPVTLEAIKADGRFAGWELVKQARLSVMPVPDPIWAAVDAMGAG